jgi:uncharacterized protein
MQTIIEHLRAATGGNIGLTVGLILLGLLMLQIAAVCFGTVRRIYFEREQQQLDRERLQLQLKAAKLQIQQAEQLKLVWNGYRKFKVVKKVSECADVCSFYLAPHDGKPLPPFKPGQYITFQLNIPGQAKPVTRCYSLSDAHRTEHYRVTIKRALPPPDVADGKPGLASSFFCDAVKEGDILDAKAPGGHFYLDLTEEKPVVLISGGVGVTPMVSMLNAILDANQKREVWFFFGCRNKADHIFKEYMDKMAAAGYENVHMQVCYSKPSLNDVKGKDYHHEGRVSVDLFKKVLPSNNYEYFLCGPGPFMKTITDDLEAWGVPDKAVHFEAFGPATVKKAAPVQTESQTAFLSKVEVTFGRSNKKARWNPNNASMSLLEFAEANGVSIEAGCRAGSCLSCKVAIKSGEVEYLTAPAEIETGSCLACICKPKNNLVLDA